MCTEPNQFAKKYQVSDSFAKSHPKMMKRWMKENKSMKQQGISDKNRTDHFRNTSKTIENIEKHAKENNF
jgi:hypothetical protein